MISVLLFLKSIRWEVWAGLALVALFLWFRAHYIGIGLERCASAHKATEVQAQAKADQAAKTAQANAGKVLAKVRAQTQEARNEVQAAMESVNPSCPALPDIVQQRGKEAVARARASLPAAPNR